jgi:(2Fe-2S) ferredoxin
MNSPHTRYLWVCTKKRADSSRKGSCAAQGSEELARSLKRAVVQAGLDARVCTSGCFDLCPAGPAVAIMPDGVFLRNIGEGDIGLVTRCLLEPPESWDVLLSEKLAREGDWDVTPSNGRERE